MSTAAYIVLALLVPLVIVHFLIRERRRRTVASLIVWRRLEKVLVSRRRLLARINRHLVVQMLIIACIAAALADPRLPAGNDPTGDLTILVDTSASMGALEEGGERIDLARRSVRQRIGLLQEDARVHLYESRARLVMIGTFSAADPTLVDAIEGLVARDERGRLSALLSELRSTARGTQLAVYTDGSEELPEWFVPGEGNELYRFGSAVPNVGITAFALRRAGVGDMRALVSVYNGGPVGAAAIIEVDGAAESTEVVVEAGKRVDVLLPLAVDGGESEGVATTGPARGSRVVEARIRPFGPDALERDNRAWAVVGDRARASVVVVGPRNLYLDAALESHAALDVYHLERYPSGDRETTDTALLREADLIVLNRVEEAPIVEGRVLSVLSSVSGVPVRFEGVIEGPVEPVWSTTHPIAEGLGATPFTVEFAAGYTLGGGAQPLLSVGERPIAWTWRGGTLRLVELGFSIERSELPLTEEFPLLVYRTLEWLLPEAVRDTNRSYRTGSAVPIAARIRPSVELPDGRLVLSVLVDGQYLLPDTSRAGIYTVHGGGRERLLALNLLEEAESSLRPLVTQRSFAVGAEISSSEGDPSFATDTGGRVVPTPLSPRGRSLAPWLIAIAAILLLVDSIGWVRRR